MPAEQQPWSGEPPERVAEVVAALSTLIAERLTQAATSAPDAGDQVACRNAAESAREICGMLSTES